jgi:peroxiredoxin Q/BCP
VCAYSSAVRPELGQNAMSGEPVLPEATRSLACGRKGDAMTLEEGSVAPEFALLSDEGSGVRLSDFLGQKVLIYFYPKADTPGCTKQACAVRDVYAEIESEGAVVIGISPDAPDVLRKFRQKHNLPFVLLSDPEHKVAEAYGVWAEKSMYGRKYWGIVRSHFGVDEEGRIAEFKVKVKPQSTADLALKLVSVS